MSDFTPPTTGTWCPPQADLPRCHREEWDRRRFLAAGTMYAWSAAVPAALAATHLLAADAPGDNAKSAHAVPMPQITLGKHSISRLLVGCHDFDAGSHLSHFLDREMRAYYTPEQIVKSLRRCEAAGITAWQGHHQQGPLLDAYRRHRASGGTMRLLGVTLDVGGISANTWDDFNACAKIDGCIAMAHQGEATDRLFKHGKLDLVRDCLKRIRDAGLLVGVSTHMPAVVDAVESKGWDFDYYMACVYERHRSEADLKKLLGYVPLPVGEVYLKEDPRRMFKAVRQTKRPCLAFKILAAGRLCDHKAGIERAFRETLAGVKPSDGVIVGIYDRYSDQAAENAALVRRFG